MRSLIRAACCILWVTMTCLLYTSWDAPYRRRDKAVLAAFAAANEEEIGFWKFVQYKFSAQWQAVKTLSLIHI